MARAQRQRLSGLCTAAAKVAHAGRAVDGGRNNRATGVVKAKTGRSPVKEGSHSNQSKCWIGIADDVCRVYRALLRFPG
jgi:hypothetical protein